MKKYLVTVIIVFVGIVYSLGNNTKKENNEDIVRIENKLDSIQKQLAKNCTRFKQHEENEMKNLFTVINNSGTILGILLAIIAIIGPLIATIQNVNFDKKINLLIDNFEEELATTKDDWDKEHERINKKLNNNFEELNEKKAEWKKEHEFVKDELKKHLDDLDQRSKKIDNLYSYYLDGILSINACSFKDLDNDDQERIIKVLDKSTDLNRIISSALKLQNDANFDGAVNKWEKVIKAKEGTNIQTKNAYLSISYLLLNKYKLFLEKEDTTLLDGAEKHIQQYFEFSEDYQSLYCYGNIQSFFGLHYEKTDIEKAKKHYLKAIKLLEKAFNYNSNNKQSMYNLAWCYVKIDDYNKGIELYRKINFKHSSYIASKQSAIELSIFLNSSEDYNSFKKDLPFLEVDDAMHTLFDYLKKIGDINFSTRLWNEDISIFIKRAREVFNEYDKKINWDFSLMKKDKNFDGLHEHQRKNILNITEKLEDLIIEHNTRILKLIEAEELDAV